MLGAPYGSVETLREVCGTWLQVNDWMEDLLIDSSEDLYRFKGVLAIDGWPDRFIFQVTLAEHTAH